MLTLDYITFATVADGMQHGLAGIGAWTQSAFALIGIRLVQPVSFETTKAALSRTLRRRPSRRIDARPAIEPPRRISLHEQFARTVAVVETARTRSTAAAGFRESALEKLDAAEYAIHRLMDELSTVMPQINKPAYPNQIRQPLVGVAEPAIAIAA